MRALREKLRRSRGVLKAVLRDDETLCACLRLRTWKIQSLGSIIDAGGAFEPPHPVTVTRYFGRAYASALARQTVVEGVGIPPAATIGSICDFPSATKKNTHTNSIIIIQIGRVKLSGVQNHAPKITGAGAFSRSSLRCSVGAQ